VDPFDEDVDQVLPARLVTEIGFFLVPAYRTWDRLVSFNSDFRARMKGIRIHEYGGVGTLKPESQTTRDSGCLALRTGLATARWRSTEVVKCGGDVEESN
jgi:hypothetical protein